MRFRVVACLFLTTILIAIGCRQPLTPNIDRNLAPETWITAAPQDTLTTRDEDGNPIQPDPSTIAVRFHPYWAGSDRDGEVVGFYFAVVETLPLAPPGLPGGPPPLPGPKPQDYHFTTKTDSVFIFRVSEFASDREHAFFIYAVDNLGKGDPTPARVIFNAQDNYPPRPIFDYAGGTGPIYRVRPDGTVIVKDTTVLITDILVIDPNRPTFQLAPRETVPITARLDFRWHGEPTIAGTYVTGYKYKLDEAQFVSVDSSVHSVSYNTGVNGDVIQKGLKLFSLKAIDQAGGSADSNRRFRFNFSPQTWFAGPDSFAYPKRDWRGQETTNGTGQRYVEVANWATANFPNSLFSCDTLTKWPGQHREMRTFFEIFDPDGSGPLPNRVFARSDGDTVHLNSWVVLHNGGSDLDSPYSVQVNPIDPDYPIGDCRGTDSLRALTPGPQNGSAVAFRSKVSTFLDPNGPLTIVSFSNPYPVFDPISNFREPHTASYNSMIQSGRAYAWVRAVDGHGDEDESIGSGYDIVRCADLGICAQGLDPAKARSLRKKVVSFYVNKAPELLFAPVGTGASAFFPLPGVNDSASVRSIRFNLFADDRDPFNYPPPSPGGPSTTKVIRWTIKIRGIGPDGNSFTWIPPGGGQYFSPQIDVILSDSLRGSRDTLLVQLCDCQTCETSPGQGRCVNYAIPFRVRPPAAAGVTGQAIWRRPGPGPSGEGDRSREQ